MSWPTPRTSTSGKNHGVTKFHEIQNRRRSVLQRPMRPVSVVVIDVLAGNEPQMPFTRDQHPVRALAARAGDPVGLGNTFWGVDLGFP